MADELSFDISVGLDLESKGGGGGAGKTGAGGKLANKGESNVTV